LNWKDKPHRLIMPYELRTDTFSSTPCTTHLSDLLSSRNPSVVSGRAELYQPFACAFDPLWGSSRYVHEQEVRHRNVPDSRCSAHKQYSLRKYKSYRSRGDHDRDCTLDETRKEDAQNIPGCLHSTSRAQVLHCMRVSMLQLELGQGPLPHRIPLSAPQTLAAYRLSSPKWHAGETSPSRHAIVCDKQSSIGIGVKRPYRAYSTLTTHRCTCSMPAETMLIIGA
jgi:hypothetical protein